LTVRILENEGKADILSVRLIVITNVGMEGCWEFWDEMLQRRVKSNKNVCFVDRASWHIHL